MFLFIKVFKSKLFAYPFVCNCITCQESCRSSLSTSTPALFLATGKRWQSPVVLLALPNRCWQRWGRSVPRGTMHAFSAGTSPPGSVLPHWEAPTDMQTQKCPHSFPLHSILQGGKLAASFIFFVYITCIYHCTIFEIHHVDIYS